MKNSKTIIGFLILLLMVTTMGAVAYSIDVMPSLAFMTPHIGGMIAFAGAPIMINGEEVIPNPSQLEKLISTAQKLGSGAMKSQFSDRVIYDTLPLDGRTTFNFFEGCGARRFPRTNLSENKLQRKENMIIKAISLEVLTFSVAAGDTVTAINALSAAFGGLYRSDLSIQVAQSTTLKKLPMDSLNPSFNTFAKHTSHNIMMLQCDLSIIELLEFIAQLQTVAYVAVPTAELMLKLHGQGSLFSPRANF